MSAEGNTGLFFHKPWFVVEKIEVVRRGGQSKSTCAETYMTHSHSSKKRKEVGIPKRLRNITPQTTREAMYAIFEKRIFGVGAQLRGELLSRSWPPR